MLNILLKELKYRWFEFFLGILITALVVSAFIVQYSISKSAENEIHSLAHNLGKNMMVVPEDTNMADFYSFKFNSSVMPDNYPRLALDSEAGMHIKQIQPVLFGNLNINGLAIVVMGRGLDFTEKQNDKQKLPEAIVTEKLAARLGINRGSILETGGTKFKVNRITEGDSMTSDYGIIVSIKNAQSILGKEGKINALYLGGCWCSIDVPALGKMIEGSLPGTRAITIAGMIAAQKGAVSVMREYSNAFYIAATMMVTGTILLLIFSQIRRYKREFGLFMALGTPGELINFNIWAKSCLIGIAGGLAGYLFGIKLVGLLGGRFPGLNDITAGSQIVPVLGIILLSCFIGAVIPSYTLFEIDPVETLREE
jgi:putative ABC transport system permease protein